MFTIKRNASKQIATRVLSQTQRRKFNEVAKFIDAKRPLVKNELFESNWTVHKIEKTPGDDIDLNWSLAHLQINPFYEAFRNPQLEHLLQRTYGTIDKKTKSVHVDAYPTESFDKFVTQLAESEIAWPNNAQHFDAKFYRRTHKEISYYLTYVPHLFVHDGDIGSHTGTNSAIRIVTDNAVSGIFLRNMILSIKMDDPFHYTYDAYILHAPGYRFTPKAIVEEFGGPEIDDLGLKKEEFVLVNETARNVLLSAISDTSMLMESISFVSAKNTFVKSQGIYVASDSVVNNNGHVTLLINGNQTNNLASSKDLTLYGAHHNIWSQEGLSRAWGGISTVVDEKEASNAAEGELLEKLGNGKARFTKRQTTPLPNLLKHPKNVVFMVHDSTFQLPALTRVKDTKSAVSLYVSGLTSIADDKAEFRPAFHGTHFPSPINPKELGAALEDILSSNTPHIYIINSALSAKSVESAIDLVQSEKAVEIKGDEFSGSNGSWINLKHDTLEDKGSKKGVDKLFSQIKSKVDSIPEPPKVEETGEQKTE